MRSSTRLQDMKDVEHENTLRRGDKATSWRANNHTEHDALVSHRVSSFLDDLHMLGISSLGNPIPSNVCREDRQTNAATRKHSMVILTRGMVHSRYDLYDIAEMKRDSPVVPRKQMTLYENSRLRAGPRERTHGTMPWRHDSRLHRCIAYFEGRLTGFVSAIFLYLLSQASYT